MHRISVRQKPVYVHGLGLQDALYKAYDPGASERDVIAHRWDITVAPSAPDAAVMLIEVEGPLDTELASRLWNAAVSVIRCFAPPGRHQPEVHVRFSDGT